jgi:hypothetical protein
MSEYHLHGKCVVCGLPLTRSNYDRQEVVAAIGPEGTVVCCVEHLKMGPGNEAYEKAIRLMAEAKSKQLQSRRIK